MALYRDRMSGTVLEGVPPDKADMARDTLGGATDAAQSLPGAPGAALLDVAREAFTAGMQVAAVTGVALALATAAITVIGLRRFGATTEPG